MHHEGRSFLKGLLTVNPHGHVMTGLVAQMTVIMPVFPFHPLPRKDSFSYFISSRGLTVLSRD